MAASQTDFNLGRMDASNGSLKKRREEVMTGVHARCRRYCRPNQNDTAKRAMQAAGLP
jgi:hypothetical protein